MINMILTWSMAMLLIFGSILSAQEAAAPVSKQESAAPEFGLSPQMQKEARMVGTWKFIGQIRPDMEKEEWVPYEGKAIFTLVADGAALMMDFIGPASGGMTIHGVSLSAYDREKGQWQEVWVDNLSGRMVMSIGHDVAGKRISTGTEIVGGQIMHTRNTAYDITDKSYKWMMENSLDGENWVAVLKGDYIKQ